MKILFTLLLLSLSAFAAEEEKDSFFKKLEKKKAELRMFKAKVSLGDKCRLRDYKCFEEQVMLLSDGQTEDIVSAHSLMVPFFERSIEDGDTPCASGCVQNMLAHHIDVYIKFIMPFAAGEKKSDLIFKSFPTLDGTRIRAVLDLSAIGATSKNISYLQQMMKKLKPAEITDPAVKDISVLEKKIKYIDEGKPFSESILCHLSAGDIVYDELIAGEFSKKSNEKNLARWLKEFQEHKSKVCKSTIPLDYRGLDESTRKHYSRLRDQKLKTNKCKANDFSCMRKNLRDLGIHYADDLPVVRDHIEEFVSRSKPKECNETCESQYLIRSIQTWISYLGTFDRDKLASTIDWKVYPEARYQTIVEDISFYIEMKTVLDPFITAFGKIDPGSVKDPGLKSEMKSVGKDLSDMASARVLKDSVICAMEPWLATYDKYLNPFKDKKQNQEFEIAFMEFKSGICK